MARATQPVDIDGVTFDALIEEVRTLEAQAPSYPLETGFMVQDSIILNPQMLEMTLFITNTPVTWKSVHGTSPGRVQDVITQLEALYFAKKPVTITTSEATYKNMAILTIELPKNIETGSSREVPITFQEIRMVQSRTAEMPYSYGKGGTSGVNAGTASTTSSSTPATASSGSNNSDGRKGSILYGLANGSGLTGGSSGVGGLLGGLGR